MLRFGVTIVFVLIWSTGFIVAKAVLPPQTWMGLFIGFAGVGLVLAPKLVSHGAGSLTLLTVAAALVSVLAVTSGTFVQKWLAATDLRVAASLQSVGAAMVAALVTLLAGGFAWDDTPVLWGALVWSVLVPSMVGTTLLMWMMRHGEATKVTALLLLVPPLAAVQAYVFFGETLALVQFTGFALALGGVLLTRSGGRPTGGTAS